MIEWLLIAWVCGWSGGCQWRIIGSAPMQEECLEIAFKASQVTRPVECVKVTRPTP